MVEIIKRREGSKSEKIKVASGEPQISVNSDGHLVIRIKHSMEEDTLIVMNYKLSDKVIKFSGVIAKIFDEIDNLPF